MLESKLATITSSDKMLKLPEVGSVVQDPSNRKRRTYTETRWQRRSGLSKRTRDLKIKK